MLQSSGPISAQDINTELQRSGSLSLDMKEVRELAGIPSGPISFRDLYGKTYNLIKIENVTLSYIHIEHIGGNWGDYGHESSLDKVDPLYFDEQSTVIRNRRILKQNYSAIKISGIREKINKIKIILDDNTSKEFSVGSDSLSHIAIKNGINAGNNFGFIIGMDINVLGSEFELKDSIYIGGENLKIKEIHINDVLVPHNRILFSDNVNVENSLIVAKYSKISTDAKARYTNLVNYIFDDYDSHNVNEYPKLIKYCNSI